MWSLCGPTCVVWCLVQFYILAVIQARPETLQHPSHNHHNHHHYKNHHPLREEQDHHLNVSRSKLPETVVADVDYFNKLNIEALLSNRRFVDLQIKCLIYDGPADLFCSKTKSLLPSVILDNCRLCSDEQRQKLSRVVVHMQQNYPAAWRDALVRYGSSPKFITAGQAAPSSQIFGKKHAAENDGPSNHHHYHQFPSQSQYGSYTTMTVPVLVQPQSAVEAETAALGQERLFESTPSPDQLISVVESPTPAMNPTQGYDNMFVTSSAQPPSTPVVESTINNSFPTTIQPSKSREEE